MISIHISLRVPKIVLLAMLLFSGPFSAHAALVQITQFGNQVTAGGGVSLNPDLTGDGSPDITATGLSMTPATLHQAFATIDGIDFEATSDEGGSGSGLVRVSGMVVDAITGPGVAGFTYYMPVTFTDVSYNPIGVDAILEIRAEANTLDYDQTGIVLRRLLFDLDTHGAPTGYSEFVTYPEAQHVVPVPAAVWLFGSATVGLGLLSGFRRSKP